MPRGCWWCGPAGLVDAGVRDLPGLLRPGDLMVVNDTRVIPARLHARRGEARIEVMLNRAEGGGIWHALIRNARRLRAGDIITVEGAEGCTATVLGAPEGGAALLDFGPDQAALAARAGGGRGDPAAALHRPAGRAARRGRGRLPDHLRRAPRRRGGAHRQPAFHRRAARRRSPRGAWTRATVTLHVGAGTFLPMRGDDPRAHRLHAEWGEVTPEAAAAINAARAAGGRIVAIGTTALRLLESAVDDGRAHPALPRPDRHLPAAGPPLPQRGPADDQLPSAAKHAVHAGLRLRRDGADEGRLSPMPSPQGYRFYSYGDASLLERAA